jgi:uncharacterized surface anchored protein
MHCLRLLQSQLFLSINAESNPTASNGELTISNIPVGKYVLSEVKAPNGYDLSTLSVSAFVILNVAPANFVLAAALSTFVIFTLPSGSCIDTSNFQLRKHEERRATR